MNLEVVLAGEVLGKELCCSRPAKDVGNALMVQDLSNRQVGGGVGSPRGLDLSARWRATRKFFLPVSFFTSDLRIPYFWPAKTGHCRHSAVTAGSA